jgi:hypothetical protein
MTIKYTSIFHSLKFTQIGIFGLKTNHLATLFDNGDHGVELSSAGRKRVRNERSKCNLTNCRLPNCSSADSRRQGIRVTGWVLQKRRPECSPTHFLSKLFHNSYCRKQVGKQFALLPGLPDFSWYMIPKSEKMYQMNTKCTVWSLNIPKVHEILQMVIKYINLFQST